MAILTLTPSRHAPATSFPVGSYAYIVADRPVRKLGVLVTAEPISLQVNAVGEVMSADLVPTLQVDEEEDFLYTVGVFDEEGHCIYSHNFRMLDMDVSIFDIVPVVQDINSCTPTTVRDNSL